VWLVAKDILWASSTVWLVAKDILWYVFVIIIDQGAFKFAEQFCTANYALRGTENLRQ
jgi:hypothetical protein